MKLDNVNYIYSRKNNSFEYELLRKHGGICFNDDFVLVSKSEFNEVLKLEESLFRDNYREFAKGWVSENSEYDNSYELNLLVNELLDDKNKLRKIILSQKSKPVIKSNICELLIEDDDFDKPKFYNNGNLKQNNHNYNQRMRQLYNSYNKRK